MKAVNIEWDVDCSEDAAMMPKEIEIPEGMEDVDDISDYISDVTGFCHKGYSLVESEADIQNASFDKLKSALFLEGIDAIQDFLDYEIDPFEDKDVIERRLDMAYEQMPDDILNQYYSKYIIGRKMSLTEQIQSASSRASEAHPVEQQPVKTPSSER